MRQSGVECEAPPSTAFRSLDKLQEEFHQRQTLVKTDVDVLSTSCSEESLELSDFSAELDSSQDLCQDNSESFTYSRGQLLDAFKLIGRSSAKNVPADHLFTVQAFGPDAMLATLDLPPGLTRNEASESEVEFSAVDGCTNQPEDFYFNPWVGEFVPGESFSFNQQASEWMCLNSCETELTPHLEGWAPDYQSSQPTDFMPGLTQWDPSFWNHFDPQALAFMPGHQASDLDHAYCIDEQLVLGNHFNPQASEFVPSQQVSDSNCAYGIDEQLELDTSHSEDHGDLAS
mmetsp:Transcript_139096/g.245758  ORF Transcript_139096/g.245758 Transcript_139096/m.245758 type:complete len:287 (+) Transcript_139096:54-914(+)